MQKSGPLIHTKLHPPIIRPELVLRTRLREQLSQGLRGPLTLITAPAGFGKTTLAVSCVTAYRMPVAWLSLDKNDNQAGRFLNYLVAALQEVHDAIGCEAGHLAAAQQVQAEVVLTSLINDVEVEGRDIVLVLDDYQFISSQTVHEAVAFLIEYCPSTFHLLIASRSDPPLPLSRLRARGQVVELRAADLRFTEPEATEFLNEVMGLRLDSGSVAILEERTEGWIAGLQMVALSMRNREDVQRFIEGFSGTNRYILDYLLEEVLASQPAEIQRFLLYTSILERLTAPLCEALLAGERLEGWNLDKLSSPFEPSTPLPCQQILEYLERANLFLVPLDDQRGWYRYHHLFADLLTSQLRRTHQDMIARLHTRASSWHEQNGWLDAAIEHAFAARDLDRVGQLIERDAQKLVYQVSFATLQNWIDRLPEEMALQKVWIGITQGWLWVATGRISNLQSWIDKVEEHFLARENDRYSTTEQQDIRSNLASLRAYDAFFRGDLQQCADLSRQALKFLSPSNLDLRVRILVQLGETFLLLQELEQASTYLHEAIEVGIALEDFQSVTTASMRLYKALKTLGKLNEAEGMVRKGLQALARAGRARSPVATKLEQCLGDLLRERGQMAEAGMELAQALDHARQYNTPLDIITALIYRSAWLTSQRDLNMAQKLLEEAGSLIGSFTLPPIIVTTRSLQQARVCLEKGEFDCAEQYLGDPTSTEAKIFQAKLLLKKGKREKAVSLLVQLEQDTVASQRHGELIQVLLLQAIVLRTLGEQTRALEIFARCLTLAHSQAYLMTFLDEGEPVYELLKLIQSQSPSRSLDIYVLRILQAFEQQKEQLQSGFEPKLNAATAAQEKTFPPNGLVEQLSGRELEVLDLIAMGKTNQEIAQQLIVAPGTVKAHAASIYRKLDVANRTEAVARARQLGIIS